MGGWPLAVPGPTLPRAAASVTCSTACKGPALRSPHLRHPAPSPTYRPAEYCARGSLLDVLKRAAASPAGMRQLTWGHRLSLALGAAKGVLHLHTRQPPILHRDLKVQARQRGAAAGGTAGHAVAAVPRLACCAQRRRPLSSTCRQQSTFSPRPASSPSTQSSNLLVDSAWRIKVRNSSALAPPWLIAAPGARQPAVSALAL